MCMYLTGNGVNKKHNKPNADGYLVGYKVLVQKKSWKNCNFSPSCYTYEWKIGLNISNRRSKNLSKNEINFSIIEKGFHLFCSKEEAKRYQHICSCYDSNKIIKVYYKPEDIVSYGYTRITKILVFGKKDPNFINLKSVVVTKCTVKSLKGLK